MSKQQEDALERFIQQNRDSLNQFELPDNLWGKISEELDEDEKPERVITIRYSTLRRVAAAFLLLMGAFGVWHFQSSTTSSSTSETMVAENNISLENIAPELAEAENYYTQLIVQKQEEIAQYPLEELGVDDEFKPALNELDSMYTQLKQELYEVPSQEEIINAMVSNLQMRIQILNQQLEILERIQNLKNEQKDDPIKI